MKLYTWSYVLCTVTADCPTVLQCITFPGRQRTINIPREIGSNYSQFGILLLNDPNGTNVSNIEHKHRGDAVQISTEILREWATGRGMKPVSWKTLTTVLHNIELGTLASEIEVIKVKPTMSTILSKFWYDNSIMQDNLPQMHTIFSLCIINSTSLSIV